MPLKCIYMYIKYKLRASGISHLSSFWGPPNKPRFPIGNIGTELWSKLVYPLWIQHGHYNINRCWTKNRGTPKWMVKLMENPIKMDDLGVPYFGVDTQIHPGKLTSWSPKNGRLGRFHATWQPLGKTLLNVELLVGPTCKIPRSTQRSV